MSQLLGLNIAGRVDAAARGTPMDTVDGRPPRESPGERVRPSEPTGPALTIWLTGLSGSGKSSVGAAVVRRLVARGRPAYLLDGDDLRRGLTADLGFTRQDRAENVRRVGEVARILGDAGVVAVAALVSPYAADRDRVQASHAAWGIPFLEVFVDTPLETCERRDVKGLYAAARAGGIRHFTGVDDPYEPPVAAHLRLRPSDGDAATQAAIIVDHLAGTDIPTTRRPGEQRVRAAEGDDPGPG